MQRVWPLFLSLLLLLFSIAVTAEATTLWPKQSPTRIVSLSPHITETLFAIGAGKQVVAVTDYCDYPKQALSLPKIGGFINPSLEAIISLRADLVILLASQQRTIQQLNKLGIATLAVNNRTLSDIQSTMTAVGLATGHQQAAQQLLSKMNERIAFIQKTVSAQPKPRVMISISHQFGSDAMKSIYIAGQHDFYNDLLRLSGGENAYQQAYPKVPSLSLEGILALNPDVIIDIFPEADDHAASLEKVYSQWMHLTAVNAVQSQQVHLIQADYATIPGPRIILLLDQISRLLHPHISWPKASAK
jgi:iron complex transport system substrate-binding protein